MRRREGWFLIICVAGMLALIFLAPSYGWRLRTLLGPRGVLEADGSNLAAENEALKAELAVLQNIKAQLPAVRRDYLRAMVYSHYPFNFKSELLVNAGAADGVEAGKAVVFQGVVIGSVLKVFPDTALVQTVFDSGFKMPVRIASAGYDALLVGGAYPRAVSIQKNVALKKGDVVYAAASNFPYGAPVALVGSTSISPDNLFEEAALSFTYDINAIQTVFIAK